MCAPQMPPPPPPPSFTTPLLQVFVMCFTAHLSLAVVFFFFRVFLASVVLGLCIDPSSKQPTAETMGLGCWLQIYSTVVRYFFLAPFLGYMVPAVKQNPNLAKVAAYRGGGGPYLVNMCVLL